MKKLILLVAVALFAFNVNAQEVTFGAKAGVNFANVSGDDADGFDSRTSFHVGGVVNIGVSEKFSVQPEVVYSSQGAKDSFEGIDVDYKMDYINVPVLAKFMVADGFSIEAGPQIGLLLSAKIEGEGEEVDIKDDLKGIDFSGAIGVNYEMASGLNFGARYNLGLGNIADFEDGDLKNNVIQVSIGYRFGGGGGE
jgi:hypothetical protein